MLFILQSVCVFVDDVTVLEVLKFQVAYVPSVKEGLSYDVVQMSDEFNNDFDDDFAIHSLCFCGPGALVHAV